MFWTIASWALWICAIAVGAWWLRGDRARGQTRCRRCWYELDAGVVKAALAEGGSVKCSECGRAHKTRRSMLKTKRRKRWLATAVVAGLLGYGAGVWERVYRDYNRLGWPTLVPTPALILAVPWLPEEAGSLPDRSTPATSVPYKQRPVAERVAHQIKTRLYDEEDTSWLDHWLFIRVGRSSTDEVLTERSSVRGNLLGGVVQAWVLQRRLTYEEERWARSVHTLRIETRDVWPMYTEVYARVEIRKLIYDRTLRVDVGASLYEVGAWVGPDGKTVGGRSMLREVGWRTTGGRRHGVVRIGDEHFMAGGSGRPGPTKLYVWGEIYEGDAQLDSWWPVAEINEKVPISTVDAHVTATTYPRLMHYESIGEIAGFERVGDVDTIREWIDDNVEARLAWYDDPERWRQGPRGLSLRLRTNARSDDDPKPFTFGGYAGVVVQIESSIPRSGGTTEQVLHEEHVWETSGSWWALREADGEGSRQFVSHANVPIEIVHGSTFKSLRLGGNQRIVSAWVEILPVTFSSGTGHMAPFWDLELERYFPEPILIELGWRDLERIQRYLGAGEADSNPFVGEPAEN